MARSRRIITSSSTERSTAALSWDPKATAKHKQRQPLQTHRARTLKTQQQQARHNNKPENPQQQPLWAHTLLCVGPTQHPARQSALAYPSVTPPTPDATLAPAASPPPPAFMLRFRVCVCELKFVDLKAISSHLGTHRIRNRKAPSTWCTGLHGYAWYVAGKAFAAITRRSCQPRRAAKGEPLNPSIADCRPSVRFSSSSQPNGKTLILDSIILTSTVRRQRASL